MPPTGFGSAPSVGFGYSSLAIDGITPDQNTQGGPLGLGWNLDAGGFIERSYKSCLDDSGSIQDLCWFTDNATISLNGQSSELMPTGVVDGDFSEWRLESDPGWKVVRQKRFSATAVDGGEQWIVYTPDGTQYTFGQRFEPTTNRALNSVWYVPVYGNHAGEPCYPGACQQAWRWNLDRVRDRDGNIITYSYDAEKNFYAKGGAAYAVGEYVRGGSLAEIRYGSREGGEAGFRNRILFTSKERCWSATAVLNCQWSWTNIDAWYLDSPDKECASGARCSHYAPAFYTKRVLHLVDTTVITQTGVESVVDRYFPQAEWPTPGLDAYGNQADPLHPQKEQLFLRFIEHVAAPGQTGESRYPTTRFDGASFDNRADPDIVSLYWRITGILDDQGGNATVAYTQKTACARWDANDGTPETRAYFATANTQDCYPRWSILKDKQQGLATFNRYLVNTITAVDNVAGGTPILTSYTYQGAPAYHRDDSPFTNDPQRTWSEPRGYPGVLVDRGAGIYVAHSRTRNWYFQGMSEDLDHLDQPKGGEVTYPTGLKQNDLNRLRGRLYLAEQIEDSFTPVLIMSQASTYYTGYATADYAGRQAWRLDETRRTE